MRRVLFVGVTLLIGVVIILCQLLGRERREVKRLLGNVTALMLDVDSFRTKDSLSVARAQVLSLTLKEYREVNAVQADRIESLGYKLSRTMRVQEVATETIHHIESPIRDRVLVDKMDTLVAPCFSYATRWVEVSGCIVGRAFRGRVQTRAELDIVVHRVPKKFWFIRWGTKAVQVDVVSRDKDCEVVYNRYIELSR